MVEEYEFNFNPYITDLIDFEYVEDNYPELIEEYKKDNEIEGELDDDQKEDLIIKEFSDDYDQYQWHYECEIESIERILHEHGIVDYVRYNNRYDGIEIESWDTVEELLRKMFGDVSIDTLYLKCYDYAECEISTSWGSFDISPAYEAEVYSLELFIRLGLDPEEHLSSHKNVLCIAKGNQSFFINYDNGGLGFEVFTNGQDSEYHYMGDNGDLSSEYANAEEQEDYIRSILEEYKLTDEVMEINWWEYGPYKDITKRLHGIMMEINTANKMLADVNKPILKSADIYQRMFDLAKRR